MKFFGREMSQSESKIFSLQSGFSLRKFRFSSFGDFIIKIFCEFVRKAGEHATYCNMSWKVHVVMRARAC